MCQRQVVGTGTPCPTTCHLTVAATSIDTRIHMAHVRSASTPSRMALCFSHLWASKRAGQIARPLLYIRSIIERFKIVLVEVEIIIVIVVEVVVIVIIIVVIVAVDIEG